MRLAPPPFPSSLLTTPHCPQDRALSTSGAEPSHTSSPDCGRLPCSGHTASPRRSLGVLRSSHSRHLAPLVTRVTVEPWRPEASGGACKGLSLSLLFFFFFTFWPHRAACGILVPRPGIEPAPSAVEVQSPNHWTARKVPQSAL